MSGTGRPHDGAEIARGLRFTASVLAAGFVLGWLAQFGVPGLSGFRVLWPQHWAFFTGLDRTSIVAYRTAEPGQPLVPLGANRWDGLSRVEEVRVAETRHLARQIPDPYWQTCQRQRPVDCGLDLDPGNVHHLRNDLTDPSLCGKFAIALEQTDVPPAGQLPASPTRAHRIALVELDCAR